MPMTEEDKARLQKIADALRDEQPPPRDKEEALWREALQRLGRLPPTAPKQPPRTEDD